MEKSEKTIEPEDSEIQRKKEMEIIELLPIKGQGVKPAAETDEERSNKHSAIKDHEKKKIRESIDSEINKSVWKAPNEVETPDNGAGTRNIQTAGIHTSGKTSAGHDDHGTNTHVS